MKIIIFAKRVITIVTIMYGILFAQNTPPVVTNVDFNIRNDGSKIVDITYDVNDIDEQTMTVTIAASSDSGATWNLPITQVTGAVGSGITNGTGKTIVWNAGAEIPNFYSGTVQIRITADDGYPFVCGTSTIFYQGKIYNTVQILNQCWLKENLDLGVMIQLNNIARNNGIIEKYCYNNLIINCETFGGLYEWNEAMNYDQGNWGICPQGWHIPTIYEFQALINNVNNDANALLATSTNTSGFSALLSGGRNYSTLVNPYFDGLNQNTYLLSSTKRDEDYSYGITIQSTNVFVNNKYLQSGFSVRCIKDSTHLTLLNLNGGEILRVGEIQNILWKSSNVLNIKIEFSTNGGTDWTTIVNSIPSHTESYAWSIPNTVSQLCKIRISDANNLLIQAESNAVFSISVPSISLTLPKSGERWTAGTNKKIEWISSIVSYVNIQYSFDNGANWVEIANSTSAQNGNYLWTIPSTPSLNCLIRILATYEPTIGDTSGIFAIFSTANNQCPNMPIMNYDGKEYNTIQIGTQCWLKENLNIGTMIGVTQNSSNNGIIEKYCYGNSETNCGIYGGLYPWMEAMQYNNTENRGICPEGWHIPTLADFQGLSITVNENGNTLKENGKGSGIGAGTNSSGFTALLEGGRQGFPAGHFYNFNIESNYWSSSAAPYNKVNILSLWYSTNTINITERDMDVGYSVRCIFNEAITVPNVPLTYYPSPVAVLSSGDITFSWNSSLWAESYTFELSTDSNFVNIVFNISEVTDTSLYYRIISSKRYYWRVRARNSLGLSDWSDLSVFSFNCPTSISYSGNVYNTVMNGSQCWLKENLNVGTMIQANQNATNNSIIEKYCYNNSAANCNSYGGLYQWNEAMQYITTAGSRGICPNGWHIPTLAELQILSNSVNGNGNALKSVGQGINIGAGTNASGFSALLGGGRFATELQPIPYFNYLGELGNIWSSDLLGLQSNTLGLNRNDSQISFGLAAQHYGLTVRCLKD